MSLLCLSRYAGFRAISKLDSEHWQRLVRNEHQCTLQEVLLSTRTNVRSMKKFYNVEFYDRCPFGYRFGVFARLRAQDCSANTTTTQSAVCFSHSGSEASAPHVVHSHPQPS